MPKKPIKIAIVGVGNFCSALVQGIFFYSNNEGKIGLAHPEIGGYQPEDIEVVCAFDIDRRKVGKDLSQAIFEMPNNTPVFVQVPNLNVPVLKGNVLDGVPHGYENIYLVDETVPTTDVVEALKSSGSEIIINMVPSGAQEASQWYAQKSIEAGCSFINATPAFIVSEWASKFSEANLAVVGDDIMNQIGSTILHKRLLNLFVERGVHVDETYQLDIGGSTESLGALYKAYKIKRELKTESVSSTLPYDTPLIAGSTDYIDFMQNYRSSYFWIKGSLFAGLPITIDIKLNVPDAANGGSVLLDVIRAVKLAKEKNMTGALISVSAYGFKRPPERFTPEDAVQLFDKFISS